MADGSNLQALWDPILGDSVHAYAWWTLTQDELTSEIEEQRKSAKRPASQISGPPPVAKGPPAPKRGDEQTTGTTPKTSSVSAEIPKAKAPIIKAPSLPKGIENLQFPTVELPPPKGPQPPPVTFKGNAGIREPSSARGRKPGSGSGGRIPMASAVALGRGTPSAPPPSAVGSAATINSPVEDQSHQGRSPTDRSRSRDPGPEADS